MKSRLVSDSLEYPEERRPVGEWLELKSECSEEEDREDMIQEWIIFWKFWNQIENEEHKYRFLDMR